MPLDSVYSHTSRLIHPTRLQVEATLRCATHSLTSSPIPCHLPLRTYPYRTLQPAGRLISARTIPLPHSLDVLYLFCGLAWITTSDHIRLVLIQTVQYVSPPRHPGARSAPHRWDSKTPWPIVLPSSPRHHGPRTLAGIAAWDKELHDGVLASPRIPDSLKLRVLLEHKQYRN